MKRTVLAITLLSLLAATAAACGGQAAVAGPGAQPPATAVSNEGPAANPGAASHGGPVADYVSLIDHLRAAGAKVEPAGELSQPFFSETGYGITVNGADVQVFEFADEAAARAQAQQVSPDGSSVGTSMVTWIGEPHFYQKGKIIVVYVGDDAAIQKLLESALGPQFAGGGRS